MPLRAIVRALGGDLYDGGRRANIPAPGHSRHDRSVSLLWSGARLVVHSFGRTHWREVLDYLRTEGLIDGAASGVSRPPPLKRTPEQRIAIAQRLWREARPVSGTLGERHLRLRCIRRPLPGALRFHPAISLAVYADGRVTRPALVAVITDRAGALTAVEITYLDASARRPSGLSLPRKTIGVVPAGAAVRLDAAAPRLLVAEGVATALSASERFVLPAWALLAVRNLAAWSAPSLVRDILIAADRGAAGETAAQALAGRLQRLGVAAEVAVPPAPYGDWNDAAAAESEGEGG